MYEISITTEYRIGHLNSTRNSYAILNVCFLENYYGESEYIWKISAKCLVSRGHPMYN